MHSILKGTSSECSQGMKATEHEQRAWERSMAMLGILAFVSAFNKHRITFPFYNVKAGKSLITSMNSFPRPRHTWDYKSMILLLTLFSRKHKDTYGILTGSWCTNQTIPGYRNCLLWNSWVGQVHWEEWNWHIFLEAVWTSMGVVHRTRYWIEFSGPYWRIITAQGSETYLRRNRVAQ